MECAGGECFSPCSGLHHWTIENNVAAFFWDVFDGTNDPVTDSSLDVIQFPLTFLTNWAQRDYTSFDDFYNDFKNRGLWGSQEPTAAALRVVNGVDFQ